MKPIIEEIKDSKLPDTVHAWRVSMGSERVVIYVEFEGGILYVKTVPETNLVMVTPWKRNRRKKMEKIFPTRDVAKKLQVSQDTVRRLARLQEDIGRKNHIDQWEFNSQDVKRLRQLIRSRNIKLIEKKPEPSPGRILDIIENIDTTIGNKTIDELMEHVQEF